MRVTFEAIGTYWDIVLENFQSEKLVFLIKEKIAWYDSIFSRFRADSLVTRMSHQTGMYELPQESNDLFSLYETLYQLTDGLFTPLIGSSLAQAGYDAQYSLVSGIVKPPLHWEDALTYSCPSLTIHAPVLLDIGAAGKGHLIDLVASLIENAGVESYCIDAGGDVRYRGKEKLRIGLEDPMDLTRVIGVCDLAKASICGSAGNRRKWGEYHHILNPKTLSSPQDILATWVVADTTLLADGLSTCLFLVPAEILLQLFQFQYVILYPDYSVQVSSKFPGEMFT